MGLGEGRGEKGEEMYIKVNARYEEFVNKV